MKPCDFSVAELMAFHRALHAWYGLHGRAGLPWRNTRDPYAIYLSEVMLQQTQVATVLARFYHPFLERFPTLAALAAAPREDVLKAWQGLGYYSRAGNLHRAAQASGAGLPRSVEGLLALPGVGRNTAHAVAAFAYGLPVPVMEANVKRVLHRIFALTHASEAELWSAAEALLDRENPFDYNQAMMDIGSAVCTKRAPQCMLCPANGICRGKETPEAYPAPRAGKKVPVRRRWIILRADAAGRIFAQPRTERFLQGMYQFIEREAPPEEQGLSHIGAITQSYSHFTLEAEVYVQKTGMRAQGNNWYTLEELRALPHSKAEEKMIGLLQAWRNCLR